MSPISNSAFNIDGKLLWSVFERIDLGMFIHDGSRRVLAFNGAAEKITGYGKEEIIGRDCRSIFNVDFCGESCSLCKNVASETDNFNYETQMLNKDGSFSWIRLNAFPVEGEGERPLFAVTMQEVTEVKEIQEHVGHVMSCCKIIGKSDAIKDIFRIIRTVANTDISVLIMGETGVGKELISSAIHTHSPRKKGPFIKTNCAGLPETLIESELFGHVRGAFTGATSDRIGRFEAASGGTIFLDEIGELSLPLQSKFLRVLQEKEIERLGEHKPRKVDIRIIAATNRDLLTEARQGRFREDLYYRLAGAVIWVPPLRERIEDIPLLTHHFLSEFNKKYGRNVEGVSPDLMRQLMSHSWPGNIRELYNLLESAYVMSKSRLLTRGCVPPGHLNTAESTASKPAGIPASAYGKSASHLSEEERIIKTLKDNRYNVSATAAALSMGRTTLWRKMKAYDIKSKTVDESGP